STLMNQPEVVMRRSVCWIECRRFEVLLKRSPGAMAAHDVAEVTTQQQEQEEQQKRRASHARKQLGHDGPDGLYAERRDESNSNCPPHRHSERVFDSHDRADAEQSSLKHGEEDIPQEYGTLIQIGEWPGLSKRGRIRTSICF